MKKSNLISSAFATIVFLGVMGFSNNAYTQNVNLQVKKADSTQQVAEPDSIQKSVDEAAKIRAKKMEEVMAKRQIEEMNKGLQYDTAKHVIDFSFGGGGSAKWLTMFDLGINSYTHAGGSVLPNSLNGFELNSGKSIEFNWHIVEIGLNLIHHNFFLTYGLELNINNYAFNNNVSFNPKSTYTMPYNDSTANFSKDKLVTQFLSVPVMFHYKTNPFNYFHSFEIAVGGFGGILVNSHTKQVSDRFGTVKEYNNFNLNQYKYGFTGRVGYGPLEFYFNYAVSTLFQYSKGPELTPFSVGIVLGGFSFK